MKKKNIISWIARIVVAFILLQTIFFKFTGAPESIYIFEQMGIEPYGRIGSGIVELIAGVLLLITSTRVIGALLAFGTISGALLSHFTVLGIEVNGDGGGLFAMAVVVFLLSLLLLIFHKEELPIIGDKV